MPGEGFIEFVYLMHALNEGCSAQILILFVLCLIEFSKVCLSSIGMVHGLKPPLKATHTSQCAEI